MFEAAVAHDDIVRAAPLAPEFPRVRRQEIHAAARPQKGTVLNRDVARLDDLAEMRVGDRAALHDDVVAAVGVVEDEEVFPVQRGQRRVEDKVVSLDGAQNGRPARRPEVRVGQFDLAAGHGAEIGVAAFLRNPQTARTVRHAEREAVVPVEAVVVLEGDAAVDELRVPL